jgi:hypothetical protein
MAWGQGGGKAGRGRVSGQTMAAQDPGKNRSFLFLFFKKAALAWLIPLPAS